MFIRCLLVLGYKYTFYNMLTYFGYTEEVFKIMPSLENVHLSARNTECWNNICENRLLSSKNEL